MKTFRHGGRRRSLRLAQYDYTSAGAYFVTICTNQGDCLFGCIVDGEMQLNDAGKMVEQCWLDTCRGFAGVVADEYVVMPNHFHGILFLPGNNEVSTEQGAQQECRHGERCVGAGLVPAVDGATISDGATTRVARTAWAGETARMGGVCVCRGKPCACPDSMVWNTPSSSEALARKISLGAVVGAFKSRSTLLYGRGVKQLGWLPYKQRLWLRNYYEHVVRNEKSLDEIRQYVRNNPLNWQLDQYNSENSPLGG